MKIWFNFSTSDIFMAAMVFFAVGVTALVLKTAFAEPDDQNG
jgi:hypothetical protein